MYLNPGNLQNGHSLFCVTSGSLIAREPPPNFALTNTVTCRRFHPMRRHFRPFRVPNLAGQLSRMTREFAGRRQRSNGDSILLCCKDQIQSESKHAGICSRGIEVRLAHSVPALHLPIFKTTAATTLDGQKSEDRPERHIHVLPGRNVTSTCLKDWTAHYGLSANAYLWLKLNFFYHHSTKDCSAEMISHWKQHQTMARTLQYNASNRMHSLF